MPTPKNAPYKQQVGVKGKAAKKALRKATHTKGYYKSLRTEV